jgi:hypothetical protein
VDIGGGGVSVVDGSAGGVVRPGFRRVTVVKITVAFEMRVFSCRSLLDCPAMKKVLCYRIT